MTIKFIVEMGGITTPDALGTALVEDGYSVERVSSYHEPDPIVMTPAQKEQLDLWQMQENSHGENDVFVDMIVNGTGPIEGNELLFARAWSNPELIKVEEPKRYYLKFPSDQAYFAQHDENTWYRTLSIFYAVKFTDEEIAEIADKLPEINFDALEKVEVED